MKVKPVDWALDRQMQHSTSRWIDWIPFVHNDFNFSNMLKKMRKPLKWKNDETKWENWEIGMGENAFEW